jgi:hypothetical protein
VFGRRASDNAQSQARIGRREAATRTIAWPGHGREVLSAANSQAGRHCCYARVLRIATKVFDSGEWARTQKRIKHQEARPGNTTDWSVAAGHRGANARSIAKLRSAASPEA